MFAGMFTINSSLCTPACKYQIAAVSVRKIIFFAIIISMVYEI